MPVSIPSQEVHQKRVASLCKFSRGKVKASSGYYTIKSLREYSKAVYHIFNYNMSAVYNLEVLKYFATWEYFDLGVLKHFEIKIHKNFGTYQVFMC